MRRAVFLFLFVFVLCGVSHGISRDRLKEIADLVYSLFPHVEGFVVATKGGIAVVDLGVKNRVYPGMVLTVSEKGLPFKNPITGQIIGYTEKVVGYLQILEVYPNASIGRVYTLGGAAVKAGDIVRITKARVNLFILPIVDNTGEGFNILAFSDGLRRYLDKTGRFNVMGEERVIQEISAYKGSFQEEGILRTFYSLYRDKYEAFFALSGRIEKRAKSYFFEGSIYCLNIGKKVKDFSVYLGEAGWRPSFEEEVVYASSPVEGKPYALALGDANGDGLNEIVYVVDNNIQVMRYRSKDRTYRPVCSFKVPWTFKVYDAHLSDVDGDGRDELFLLGADIKDFTVYTKVYRWKDNCFVRKKVYDGHFVKAFGRIGVSQYLLKEDPLSLAPDRILFKGLEIEKVGSIPALKGDLILGMSAFDANGDGVLDYMVNEEGRVLIKDGKTGEVIADIAGDFGNTGYAFFYREPQVKVFYEGEGFMEISKEDYARFKELTLAVPGSIAVAEVKGQRLVALFRNKPYVWGAYFAPFKSGTVKIYRWADGYFEDTGWIRTLPEGVVAVALGDVNGDGREEVVLLTVRGIKSRREGLKFTTRLVIYKGPGE